MAVLGLNISGTIVRPVPAGGNNATNVSTEMIWDNQLFYETKLGWTFGPGGNWTLMDTPENYQLPILRWQSATPAGVDASYLSITHEVNATVIGTGGSITHSGKQIHKDGASVTFTLNADPGYTVDTLTDNGATQSISNRYTIPDVDRLHEIIATFRLSPVPPVPPVPSDDSSSNMDNAYRVLFETSGGSFISPTTGLSAGDRITEPPAPTKEGYTFGGWYTDEDCTHAWNFADGIPGGMTLYANGSAVMRRRRP